MALKRTWNDDLNVAGSNKEGSSAAAEEPNGSSLSHSKMAKLNQSTSDDEGSDSSSSDDSDSSSSSSSSGSSSDDELSGHFEEVGEPSNGGDDEKCDETNDLDLDLNESDSYAPVQGQVDKGGISAASCPYAAVTQRGKISSSNTDKADVGNEHDLHSRNINAAPPLPETSQESHSRPLPPLPPESSNSNSFALNNLSESSLEESSRSNSRANSQLNDNLSIEGEAPETNGDSASFDVLDDLKASEETFDAEMDSVDEDEIFDMLDQPLPKSTNKGEEDDIVPREERLRTILVEKGRNHFDVLPDGWIKVQHFSGMPIYLHRTSRVVSVSKPYFLGSGSARRHLIPVESIPCLSYKRALEEEETTRIDNAGGESGPNNIPQAKIESIEDVKEKNSLEPEEVQKYCESLFKFKTVRIQKFKNWTERRKFEKQLNRKRIKSAIARQKEKQDTPADGENGDADADTIDDGEARAKARERPTLPEGTLLITVPVVDIQNTDEKHPDNALYQRITKRTKKEWLLNPAGKSTVCILHEYMQHSLRKQPQYVFEEVDSSSTPYSAVVVINGIEFGKGVGSSKRLAKNNAAKKTLEILIPEIKGKLGSNEGEDEADMPDLTFFDDVRIEDPRVMELCNRTSEPSPYAILVTCLQRNYGLGDTNIHSELRQMRNKKNEFYMRVNQREVTVICKNKRDGKQMAAQKLLQLLHPHIKNWGSLLRLYGSRAIMTQKVKREKESEVTTLQSRNPSRPTPSLAILEKLKEEMRNLSKKKNSVEPIGKFVPPLDARMPGINNTCLEKVDL